MGFPGSSVIKNLPANAGDTGDTGWIPRWGRSPGEGNGNPLQYSCLENPMDRAWWTIQSMGATKSQTPLSACTCIDTHTHKQTLCTDAWMHMGKHLQKS